MRPGLFRRGRRAQEWRSLPHRCRAYRISGGPGPQDKRKGQSASAQLRHRQENNNIRKSDNTSESVK
eukprot:14263694-Ditylum_brightwellii.AAC.1